MTTWLINSAVIPAGAWGTYTYREAMWVELAGVMSAARVRSRIGYAETADVIQRVCGSRPQLNRDVSALAPGDGAYVVRLKYRVGEPGKKGQPTHTRDTDWEIGFLQRIS